MGVTISHIIQVLDYLSDEFRVENEKLLKENERLKLDIEDYVAAQGSLIVENSQLKKRLERMRNLRNGKYQ